MTEDVLDAEDIEAIEAAGGIFVESLGEAPAPVLTEREQVLETLKDANITTIKELAAQGINLAPQLTAQLMVDEIYNTLFPEGSPERVEFHIRLEIRIREILEGAPEQARKARLAQGIAPPQAPRSPLIVPGR